MKKNQIFLYIETSILIYIKCQKVLKFIPQADLRILDPIATTEAVEPTLTDARIEVSAGRARRRSSDGPR